MIFSQNESLWFCVFVNSFILEGRFLFTKRQSFLLLNLRLFPLWLDSLIPKYLYLHRQEHRVLAWSKSFIASTWFSHVNSLMHLEKNTRQFFSCNGLIFEVTSVATTRSNGLLWYSGYSFKYTHFFCQSANELNFKSNFWNF